MAKVLMPIAEGFEELEAVTIVDVLRRADIEVTIAGLKAGPVTGSRGTRLIPDAALDQVDEATFDMIVLPGGMPGVKHLQEDPRIKKLLESFTSSGRYTSAICAAPSILASYGLLDGREATSNPKFKDQVAIPGVTYQEKSVVRDGKVITSRGPGTSIDFALELVGELAGSDKRMAVEAGLVRPS